MAHCCTVMFNSAMTPKPLRVAVKVPSQSPSYTAAWDDGDRILTRALDAMTEASIIDSIDAPKPRLIALDRYNLAVFIVFDVFHDAYDASTGHLREQNDLRVCTVYFGRREVAATMAPEGIRRMVNEEIQRLHNLNGDGSVPPFRADHLNGQGAHYEKPSVSSC